MTSPAPAATDEELAARAGRGEPAAFSELYERYFEGAYDFTARIVRDRDLAGDVVQEAFTRAWEQLQAGEPPRRFKAWLYTIARNRAIDELRRGRREPTFSSRAGDEEREPVELGVVDPDRFADPAEAVQRADVAQLVWDAASSLSANEYSLLDMHVRRSLTAEEMASELGVSSGALYTRLSRLRNSVEESLAAELLRRRGRGDCPELDRIVAALEGSELTREGRRAILDHAEECEICSERRRSLVTAAELLAALAPVGAAPGLQSEIWARTAEAIEASPSGSGGGAGGAGAGGATGAAGAAAGLPVLPIAVIGGVLALVVAAALVIPALLGGGGLSDPSGFRSSSHQIGVPSNDRVVSVEWDRHESATGFSIVWSRQPEELPDAIADLPGSATGAQSASLDDGAWYFHLRTQGEDGEWTSTVHLGPFLIGVSSASNGGSSSGGTSGGGGTGGGSEDGGPSEAGVIRIEIEGPGSVRYFVWRDPTPRVCPPECEVAAADYRYDLDIQRETDLDPGEEQGARIIAWGGACEGIDALNEPRGGRCVIALTGSDQLIRVVFEKRPRLEIQMSGQRGFFTLSHEPVTDLQPSIAGRRLSCGAPPCSVDRYYDLGTVVTIDSGDLASLRRWGGACDGVKGADAAGFPAEPCTVALDDDVTVTIQFSSWQCVNQVCTYDPP